MDIEVSQIKNKRCTLERHQQDYRYQLKKDEWCEIKLTLERIDGENWQLIELFVSTHNYDSNQMTLDGLANRLCSMLVSKTSSPKSWDNAKYWAGKVFYYLQATLSNYGVNFQYGGVGPS